jgi:hypothetical protein
MAIPAPQRLDPAELPAGLLMPVANVHERLRQARERHRVNATDDSHRVSHARFSRCSTSAVRGV